MAGDDGNGEKSTKTIRWIDAARYVLALVMTALIVAVTVHAITVVLRPDRLSVLVVGGSLPLFTTSNLSLSPSPSSPAKNAEILLDVNVRFHNPSGRVRMYYTNIKVYLFGNDSRAASSNPAADSFIFVRLASKEVPQLITKETNLQMHLMSDVHPYFDMLYGGGVIRGVTMRIEGDLITEVVSGINKTSPNTTYYCTPVVVGGDPDDKALSNRPDLPCTEPELQQN